MNLSERSGLEIIFAVCACVGGVLLAVRLVLQFIGISADHDVPGESDTDIHHVDADSSFKILTFQGLMAFTLMFGLVGLATFESYPSSPNMAVFAALVAGLFSAWFLDRMFRRLRSLESSGTLNADTLVGCDAKIYMRIEPGKSGRVHIYSKQGLIEYDAKAENPALAIDVGTSVVVRAIHNDHVIVGVSE